MFNKGETYSKTDIYRILKVPIKKQKGSWNTGYTKYENSFYVFANIGIAGRTGHNYNNHWDGNDLVWFAKNGSTLHQPIIQSLLLTDTAVHIFTRTKDRNPFTYQGLGYVKEVENASPVKVIWRFEKTHDFDPLKAWHLFLENAMEYIKTNESYFSTLRSHEYKIQRVTKRFVTVQRVSIDSKTIVKISFSAFKKSISKLNASNGVLPRTTLHSMVAIETTIVRLLPMLDWDTDFNHIIVNGTRPKLNEEILYTDISEAKNDDNVKGILRQLRLRRGQNKLRQNLIKIYQNKCCITGCNITELLHACHITPHAKSGNNNSTNALLLRSDIHDLFDCNLIGIHPKSLTIKVKGTLSQTEYSKLSGIKLLPRRDQKTPNLKSLKHRWRLFKK